MKVYPYRTESGYCSILEAVDFNDAKEWLNTGTVFCEVEMEPSELMSKYGPDIDKHVNGYLDLNETVKI